jgi:hypothetical protein
MTLTNALEYAPYYAVAAVVVSLLLRKEWSSKLPYPPGPKGLPLIGNIQDIPSSQEWLTYAKWGREFSQSCLPIIVVAPLTLFHNLDSDVIRLNLAGSDVLVVNTHDAAFELFDRRSAIYSDRVRLLLGAPKIC